MRPFRKASVPILGLGLALLHLTSARADRIEDARLNFAFEMPPSSAWTRVPPQGLRANFVLVRSQPPMRFRLLARDVGAPSDMSDEEVLVRALDTIGVAGPGAELRVISSRERTINDIPGVQTANQLSMGGRTSYDVNWLGSRAGIVYWLNLSSEAAPLQRVVIESRTLFEHLSLLDPKRSASAQSPRIHFRSRRFGYSIDLSATGFAEANRLGWPKRVEFAAALPGHDPAAATLLVIPVYLSREIPVDPELADAALCSMMHPGVKGWRSLRSADVSGVRIREYDGRRVGSGKPASYRVRIFQRDRYFIAIGVVVEDATEARTETLLATTALLEIDPTPPVEAPLESSDGERLRKLLFLNAVGVEYSRRGRHVEAIRFFERAHALGATDPIYARNLAEARVRAGRIRDAVAGLDEALSAHPKDPVLLGWRGVGRAALGEREGAAADLRRAIELGNSDEGVLATYVVTLADTGSFDAALDVLEARIQQTNSLGARLLRTLVLRRAGRGDEATDELRNLLREHPSNTSIRSVMVGIAMEDGDPAAFLDATESLVAQDATGIILYLRAMALRALGRIDAAIEALDLALERAPESEVMRALRQKLEAERASGPERT